MRDYIAQVVREARRARGLTQEDLAARIGLATQSLSNLERGKTMPTIATLMRMAEELDMPVASFLPTRGPGKSDQRLSSEAQIAAMLDCLSDQEVKVAAGLIAVLVRMYEDANRKPE
jgi:transcriptional regulator with XRE-family HTH domain